MTARQIFDVAQQGSVLIVSPLRNVSSLADETVRTELGDVLAQLDQGATAAVLIDFDDVAYFGSSMLEALLQIWNRLRRSAPQGEATMAICGLSDVAREIITLARFDTLWSLYDSREEALAALAGD